MEIDSGIRTDVDNATYHAASDWISCSKMKAHLPEWFKPMGPTASMDNGSVMHRELFGTDEELVIVAAATWQGKDAKEKQETARHHGVLPVLQKDYDTIRRMVDAIGNHREARRLLIDEPGSPEVSVFAKVDDVKMKCRFDRLLDDGTPVDLKTTKNRAGRQQIARAIIDYGYEVQADHYEQVGEAAGLSLASKMQFCFVQNEPPYAVTVADLDDDWYQRGRTLRDIALDRILHPTMVEPYEGAVGVLNLSMPRWARL
jgi:hypothetical protein